MKVLFYVAAVAAVYAAYFIATAFAPFTGPAAAGAAAVGAYALLEKKQII